MSKNSDTRFRSDANNDPERASRASESRDIDERRLQDEDRLMDELASIMDDVLPTLPPIKGYHVCWLTTTSNYDTIPKRARLGYIPVTAEDVPDFKHLTLKSTDHAGMIGWNEMIAYKIPVERYQAMMMYQHHRKPLQDEQMLSEDHLEEKFTDNKRSKPLTRDVGDGTQELGDTEVPRPTFAA